MLEIIKWTKPEAQKSQNHISDELFNNLEKNTEELEKQIINLFNNIINPDLRNYNMSFYWQHSDNVNKLRWIYHSLDNQQKKKIFDNIKNEVYKIAKGWMDNLKWLVEEQKIAFNDKKHFNYNRISDTMLAIYLIKWFFTQKEISFHFTDEIFDHFNDLKIINKKQIDKLVVKSALQMIINLLKLIKKSPKMILNTNNFKDILYNYCCKSSRRPIFKQYIGTTLWQLGLDKKEINSVMEFCSFFSVYDNLADINSLNSKLQQLKTILDKHNESINQINLENIKIEEYSWFMLDDIPIL